MSRKLFIYIATSLDGYIAKPGDDLAFLDRVDREGEDYGYNDFIADVDTVIVGKRTYDWVMTKVDEFPHANKESYIITHEDKPKEDNITFYSDDLKELIEKLKRKNGKNIFCDGGADIIHQLLQQRLVDEFIIAVIPVLVGDGIRLFKDGRPETDLELIAAKPFESGLVQLHYKAIKST